MILYCATTNAGKLREFRLAAEQASAGGIRIEPLPALAGLPPCEETGATFEENAVLKALYYGAHTEGWLFAEDSGLEVDALDGAPGVYSARFAGEGAGDEANNRLLLEKLCGCSDRIARFVSVVALVSNGCLAGTFRGVVEGHIAEAPRGSNGFGYDPLFFYPPFGGTLAEASPEQKLSVSHRGKAVSAALEFLAASTEGSRPASWRP